MSDPSEILILTNQSSPEGYFCCNPSLFISQPVKAPEFPNRVRGAGWKQTAAELNNGSYQPAPVRRVNIEKPDGGKRQLGIPTVRDRVIQQAIAQVLTPIFDPGFSSNSFGFRPHRNGQQAVKKVHRIIQKGYRIAVDVDLSKFFDRVNHDLLMTLLSRKVKDKRLMQLIGRYLRAGVQDGQRVQDSREAVPQGGHSHHCYRTLCSTPWTKNWNSEATSLPDTPTTLRS